MNSNLKINRVILETYWPNLDLSNHTPKSDPDVFYNCIAWALGNDDDRWAPYENHKWFDGLKKLPSNFDGDDTRNYIEGFEILGYKICEDGNYEENFEKIAIYKIDKSVQHIARQIKPDIWTSKLGEFDDIEHTISALEGGKYGVATIFMKRKKSKTFRSKINKIIKLF